MVPVHFPGLPATVHSEQENRDVQIFPFKILQDFPVFSPGEGDGEIDGAIDVSGRLQHTVPLESVLYVRPLREHSDTVIEESSSDAHAADEGALVGVFVAVFVGYAVPVQTPLVQYPEQHSLP